MLRPSENPAKLAKSPTIMNTTEELKKVITPCISVCKYNDNNYLYWFVRGT